MQNNGNGTFGTATNVTVGSSPVSVAVGDFNGDGKPDIVVADHGSDSVSLLLNNGSGGFSTVTNFTVSSNPYAVAVGDFNGDGKLDFASANADGTVTIFTGNGNGTFAATNYTVGTSPISALAAGDFNGDGKTDLAAASESSGNITILSNTTTIAPVSSTNLSVGSNKTIDGGNNFTSLLFSLTSNVSNTVSEVGVFAVNNDSGAITTANGTTLTPGQAGYTQAVLSESQILYGFDPVSVPSGSFSAQRQLLSPGSNLGFYIITNGTANQEQAALAGQITNKPNVFFNFSAANSDGLNHLQITSTGTNQFNLQWNTTLGSSSAFNGPLLSLSTTTSSQNLNEGIVNSLIDTRTTGALTVNFKVTSNALFSDFVGFYAIENTQGTITANGKTLNPGDAGYAAAAVSQVMSSLEFDQQIGTVTHSAAVYNPNDQPWQATLTDTFAAGQLYAPVLIANGNIQTFLAQNSSNSAPTNLNQGTAATPVAYFAFVNANGDGIDHVRSLPGYALGFKDFYGGGDLDYNDIVLNFSNASVSGVSAHPTSVVPTYA